MTEGVLDGRNVKGWRCQGMRVYSLESASQSSPALTNCTTHSSLTPWTNGISFCVLDIPWFVVDFALGGISVDSIISKTWCDLIIHFLLMNLSHFLQIAVEDCCCRMDFMVLNWNFSSIEYYKRKGCQDQTAAQKLHMYRLPLEALKKLASK